MPSNSQIVLDAADRGVVAALQRDGRMSVADLARAVNLSPSATADRLRRLTDLGVITGYTAVVDPEALGYTVQAFVRLAYPSGNYKPFHDLLAVLPEVVEAHHVTGDDCFSSRCWRARCATWSASPASWRRSAASPRASSTRARSPAGTSRPPDGRPRRRERRSRWTMLILAIDRLRRRHERIDRQDQHTRT